MVKRFMMIKLIEGIFIGFRKLISTFSFSLPFTYNREYDTNYKTTILVCFPVSSIIFRDQKLFEDMVGYCPIKWLAYS